MINNRSVQNPYELSFLMKQQLQKKITRIVFFIFFTIVVILFVRNFVLFSFRIQSNTISSLSGDTPDIVFVSPIIRPSNKIFPSSMNIQYGDLVLVNTIRNSELSFFKKLLKNTVSFFTLNKITLYSDHPSTITNASLLRVLAFPGDTIYIKDSTLYIKNKNNLFFLTEFELSKKEYSIKKAQSLDEKNHPLFLALSEMQERSLKDGEYFLLSDNRLANLDSRLWGPIEEKNIKGKALFRLQYFKKAAFL